MLIGERQAAGANVHIRKCIFDDSLGSAGNGKDGDCTSSCRTCGAGIFSLSAISSGVKDLRQMIEETRRANARNKKRSILFIDEIHRFSKSQQDALLGAVEDGTITLIGATTENPSFEVISPLLSRAKFMFLSHLMSAISGMFCRRH